MPSNNKIAKVKMSLGEFMGDSRTSALPTAPKQRVYDSQLCVIPTIQMYFVFVSVATREWSFIVVVAHVRCWFSIENLKGLTMTGRFVVTIVDETTIRTISNHHVVILMIIGDEVVVVVVEEDTEVDTTIVVRDVVVTDNPEGAKEGTTIEERSVVEA